MDISGFMSKVMLVVVGFGVIALIALEFFQIIMSRVSEYDDEEIGEEDGNEET